MGHWSASHHPNAITHVISTTSGACALSNHRLSSFVHRPFPDQPSPRPPAHPPPPPPNPPSLYLSLVGRRSRSLSLPYFLSPQFPLLLFSITALSSAIYIYISIFRLSPPRSPFSFFLPRTRRRRENERGGGVCYNNNGTASYLNTRFPTA
jgi:hypothetical protein